MTLEFTFTPDPGSAIAGSFQMGDSVFTGLAGPIGSVSTASITAFDFTDGFNTWGLGDVLTGASTSFDVTGLLPQVVGGGEFVASIGADPFFIFTAVPAIQFQDATTIFGFESTATGVGSWSTAVLSGPAPAP